MFEQLMEIAKMLGQETHYCVEASDTLEEDCEIFDRIITLLWRIGKLSNHEFNLLALEAFYDYPEGLKPDPEFDI